MKSKYIIEDWAGNIFDYAGRFMRPNCAVPLEFKSFEDGWGYIYEKFPGDEELWGDLYVMKKGGK